MLVELLYTVSMLVELLFTGLMAEARPVSIFDSPMSSRHSTDESTAAVDYCQQTAPDMYSVYNTTTLFSTTQVSLY